MIVRKTGAFLMLLVLALWASTPALACFAPAQQHACCSQMMQDCGPTMNADTSCCQVHRTDTVNPPVQASKSERPLRIAPAVAEFEVPSLTASSASRPQTDAEPPPRLSASSSILRI